MAWQAAPGLIVISGGFALVGALYAGIDGLNKWIYNKVSPVIGQIRILSTWSGFHVMVATIK